MKRITDSQVIKHTDGSFHEQLYCFGHLWGPAYIKKESKDYEEYLQIIQKLKAYEDTGREPEEITGGKNQSDWIPVSDRMPETEEDTWYWCTCYAPHRGYFTQPAQWWPAIGEFIKPAYKGEVIAWMEKMPSPYVPTN